MKPETALYDAQIAEAVASATTWKGVAEHLGVSPDKARHAARRRGLSIRNAPHMTRLAETALNLPAHDAVTYLIEVLETLALIAPAVAHEADEIAPRATEKERRLLIALVDAGGRTVSKEALYTAAYIDAPGGGETEIKIIDVFICKLRHKITRGRIGTDWGRGYFWSEDPDAPRICGKEPAPRPSAVRDTAPALPEEIDA